MGSVVGVFVGAAFTSAADVGGGGGGSMIGAPGECFETGSGRDGIGSSDDEVSMVMCFVVGGDCRRVYMMGEHLTTTDGFLCPGR